MKLQNILYDLARILTGLGKVVKVPIYPIDCIFLYIYYLFNKMIYIIGCYLLLNYTSVIIHQFNFT